MPSPGCPAPAWRSVPVSLTRFQVSKHLRVAHERLCTTVPRFPRPGPPRRRSPASSVLSGHYDALSEYGVTYLFRFPAPVRRLLVPSLRWRQPQGMAPVSARCPQPPRLVGNRVLPGSWESIPHFCRLLDSGRPACPHLIGQSSAAPTSTKVKAPAVKCISELNDTASVSAAYASISPLPDCSQGSLPAGG